MKLIILIFFIVTFLDANPSILVINSNKNVEKYTQTLDAFKSNFKHPFEVLDISNMKAKEIKEYLYDEYPDMVYTIGAKAYRYTYSCIPEKKIFFSSIVNYKRLPMQYEEFGISNELHTGMQLTLIKSVFNNIKSISVIYSKYTKSLVDELIVNAKKLNIKILCKEVSKDSIKSIDFDKFLDESESIMIISDPVFLRYKDIVKKVLNDAEVLHKPIFSYHRMFLKYGAVLAITADNPTVGRQMAGLIERSLKNKKIKKVQYPSGTKVIFNKKIAKQLKIPYSSNINFLANEIIE